MHAARDGRNIALAKYPSNAIIAGMSLQARKERERAQRHQLIVTAARELAEAEGWDAVTTRRLADRVEYSQPVLYSHFASREAIIAEVALQGFAELAAELRRARLASRSPRAAVAALADAYLHFADSRPALYQAMFTMPIDVPFATQQTPAPLRAGFSEFAAALEPLAAGRDTGTYAEVVWSALHGLAALSRDHRLSPGGEQARLGLLIDLLTAPVPGAAPADTPGATR
jgi:AcrR family transcriptional regulator